MTKLEKDIEYHRNKVDSSPYMSQQFYFHLKAQAQYVREWRRTNKLKGVTGK